MLAVRPVVDRARLRGGIAVLIDNGSRRFGNTMPRFTIHAREVLVGHSRLEHGDAPMGVAFGVFEPAPDYATIRDECIANHADPSHLGLVARIDGAIVPCAGVGIVDGGADGIEVTVLGIPYPQYETLFPEHVAAYRRLFG